MTIQESTAGIVRSGDADGSPSEECCCVSGFYRLIPCVIACTQKCGDYNLNQTIVFVQANEFVDTFGSGACGEAPNSKYFYQGQCYELSCTTGQTPSGDQPVVTVSSISKASDNQSCADCCGPTKDTSVYCDCHGCGQLKLPCGVANAGGGGTVQTGQDLKFKAPGASTFSKCMKFIRNENAADASEGGAIDSDAQTAGDVSSVFEALNGDCLTDSDCVGSAQKPGGTDGCGITGHCGCDFDCGDVFGPNSFGCGDAVGESPSALSITVPPIEGAGQSHQCSNSCGVSDCDNAYCGGTFVVSRDFGHSSACGYLNLDTEDQCADPYGYVKAKYFTTLAEANPQGLPPPYTVPICDACAGCLAGGFSGGGGAPPDPPFQFPINDGPGMPINGAKNGKMLSVIVRPRAQNDNATAGNCWEISIRYMSLVQPEDTSRPCGMSPATFQGAFLNAIDLGAGAAGPQCVISGCGFCDGTPQSQDQTNCPCSIGVSMRNGNGSGGSECTCCGEGTDGCNPVDVKANVGCCDVSPSRGFAWIGKKTDTSNDSACPFGSYSFDQVVGEHLDIGLLLYTPFINTGTQFTPSGTTCGAGTTYTAVPPACTATGAWTGLSVTVD